MRRHPARRPAPPDDTRPGIGPIVEDADRDGAELTAWRREGGLLLMPTPGPNDPDWIASGVQVVASFYVPRGRIALVKEIQVAPFRWPGAGEIPIDPVAGVWTTPLGWEFGTPPNQWKWHLGLISGTIEDQRATQPMLPNGWLSESPHSPAIYGNAFFPAKSIAQYDGQRIQRAAGATSDTSVNVIVPSRTTVILWVDWLQTQLQSRAYALGPSFGVLGGYTTNENTPSALKAVERGWQG